MKQPQLFQFFPGVRVLWTVAHMQSFLLASLQYIHISVWGFLFGFGFGYFCEWGSYRLFANS